MKKLLTLLALTAAIYLPAQFPMVSPGKLGSANRAGKPTTITSDVMDLDLARNRATFMGNVIIDDPDMTLTCNTMTLYLSDTEESKKDKENKENKEEARDEFSGKRLTMIECLDDVVMTRKNQYTKGELQTVTAGKAVYLDKDGSITLTKNPVMTKGNSTLRGTRITLYINSERMTIATGRIEAHPNEFRKDGDKK